MKTKQNKLFITIFLAMFVLAVIPMVSAATTLTNTVAGGNYSDSLITTVTVDPNTADNMTNVTCYYNKSGGAATTFLVEMLNSTPDDLVFQNTTVISGFDETMTYNISCNVYTETGADSTLNLTISVAGITFDHTDPLCSLIRQSRTIAWKDTQLITWTSSDALSLVSTAVYVDRPEEGSTMSYTDTNRVLTLLSQDTKYLGDWTVNITGTDRPGNTCTAEVTFKTYMPDGEIWEPTEPKKDTGKTLLLLAIVGIVAYFIFKKK